MPDVIGPRRYLVTGDVVHLLHIVIRRAFGSGLFPSIQPSSPKLIEDRIEVNHARSCIEDRFVPVLEEHGVSFFLKF